MDPNICQMRAGLGLASLEVVFFGARGCFVLEAAAVPHSEIKTWRIISDYLIHIPGTGGSDHPY